VTVRLSDDEKAILDGTRGAAAARAMEGLVLHRPWPTDEGLRRA
jgi:predicted aconitase